MSIAMWCVLLAGLLPIFTVAVAKWGDRSFDNHEPRAWMERQTGLRRRADYAHRNHFEAFGLFAVAVLYATVQHMPATTLDRLAVGYIVLRLLYTVLYLTDRSTLRSVVWTGSWAVAVAIFIMPLWA